jgi:nucleoside-diphosphate-sugar epimerase
MREGAFYTQVFPIFYKAITNNKPITIYGDGSQTMDLIHAEDIAEANMLGLESDVTGEFFEKYFIVGWMKRFSELMCEM